MPWQDTKAQQQTGIVNGVDRHGFLYFLSPWVCFGRMDLSTRTQETQHLGHIQTTASLLLNLCATQITAQHSENHLLCATYKLEEHRRCTTRSPHLTLVKTPAVYPGTTSTKNRKQFFRGMLAPVLTRITTTTDKRRRWVPMCVYVVCFVYGTAVRSGVRCNSRTIIL